MTMQQIVPRGGYLPVTLVNRGDRLMDSSYKKGRKGHKLGAMIPLKRRPAINPKMEQLTEDLFQRVRQRQSLLDSEQMAYQELKAAAGLTLKGPYQVPFTNDMSTKVFEQLKNQIEDIDTMRGNVGYQKIPIDIGGNAPDYRQNVQGMPNIIFNIPENVDFEGLFKKYMGGNRQRRQRADEEEVKQPNQQQNAAPQVNIDTLMAQIDTTQLQQQIAQGYGKVAESVTLMGKNVQDAALEAINNMQQQMRMTGTMQEQQNQYYDVMARETKKLTDKQLATMQGLYQQAGTSNNAFLQFLKTGSQEAIEAIKNTWQQKNIVIENANITGQGITVSKAKIEGGQIVPQQLAVTNPTFKVDSLALGRGMAEGGLKMDAQIKYDIQQVPMPNIQELQIPQTLLDALNQSSMNASKLNDQLMQWIKNEQGRKPDRDPPNAVFAPDQIQGLAQAIAGAITSIKHAKQDLSVTLNTGELQQLIGHVREEMDRKIQVVIDRTGNMTVKGQTTLDPQSIAALKDAMKSIAINVPSVGQVAITNWQGVAPYFPKEIKVSPKDKDTIFSVVPRQGPDEGGEAGMVMVSTQQLLQRIEAGISKIKIQPTPIQFPGQVTVTLAKESENAVRQEALDIVRQIQYITAQQTVTTEQLATVYKQVIQMGQAQGIQNSEAHQVLKGTIQQMMSQLIQAQSEHQRQLAEQTGAVYLSKSKEEIDKYIGQFFGALENGFRQLTETSVTGIQKQAAMAEEAGGRVVKAYTDKILADNEQIAASIQQQTEDLQNTMVELAQITSGQNAKIAQQAELQRNSALDMQRNGFGYLLASQNAGNELTRQLGSALVGGNQQLVEEVKKGADQITGATMAGSTQIANSVYSGSQNIVNTIQQEGEMNRLTFQNGLRILQENFSQAFEATQKFYLAVQQESMRAIQAKNITLLAQQAREIAEIAYTHADINTIAQSMKPLAITYKGEDQQAADQFAHLYTGKMAQQNEADNLQKQVLEIGLDEPAKILESSQPSVPDAVTDELDDKEEVASMTDSLPSLESYTVEHDVRETLKETGIQGPLSQDIVPSLGELRLMYWNARRIQDLTGGQQDQVLDEVDAMFKRVVDKMDDADASTVISSPQQSVKSMRTIKNVLSVCDAASTILSQSEVVKEGDTQKRAVKTKCAVEALLRQLGPRILAAGSVAKRLAERGVQGITQDHVEQEIRQRENDLIRGAGIEYVSKPKINKKGYKKFDANRGGVVKTLQPQKRKDVMQFGQLSPTKLKILNTQKSSPGVSSFARQ